MIRQKMPRNRSVRRELCKRLIIDGKQEDYVKALLGFSFNSLSPNTKHLLMEHPLEVRDLIPEIFRLMNDDSYREQEINKHLERYGLKQT